MKRLICLFGCLLSFALQAGDCFPLEEENFPPIEFSPGSGPVFLDNVPLECDKTWTLDVRVAYYSPQSKMMKKIYSDSWFDFQVEASKRLFDYIEFWFGVSWANKQHGHREPFRYGFKDKTRMYILPLNAGIKFVYPVFCHTDLYLGAGVCCSFMEIRNRLKKDRGSFYYSDSGYYSSSSSYDTYTKNIHKTGWGGLFKVGLRYRMCETTFLDLFADYYLQRFKLSHKQESDARDAFGNRIDCSGFKIGAGLGVFF